MFWIHFVNIIFLHIDSPALAVGVILTTKLLKNEIRRLTLNNFQDGPGHPLKFCRVCIPNSTCALFSLKGGRAEPWADGKAGNVLSTGHRRRYRPSHRPPMTEPAFPPATVDGWW